MEKFEWNGQQYGNFVELGRKMLEKLWLKDAASAVSYFEMLKSGAISSYIEGCGETDSEIYRQIKRLEILFGSENTLRGRARRLYISAYELSADYFLYVDDHTFRNTEELCDYCEGLMAVSFEAFSRFAELLVAVDGQLDVQFEAWLIVLGKSSKVENWLSAYSLIDNLSI